jgi:hypothetical protein
MRYTDSVGNRSFQEIKAGAKLSCSGNTSIGTLKGIITGSILFVFLPLKGYIGNIGPGKYLKNRF